MAPLAHDPGVQKAIANQVTTVIFDNLDVRAVTSDALTALADRPNVPPRVAEALPSLAIPIAIGVESFTKGQGERVRREPAVRTTLGPGQPGGARAG